MIVNRRLRRRIGLAAVSGMLMLSLSSFMPAKNEFTARVKPSMLTLRYSVPRNILSRFLWARLALSMATA